MAYKEQLIRARYAQLTGKLIEQKKTITTMESCTSGQIASLITDTEGASAVLKGAFVTYSNMAKVMAGVDAAVIEQYGVYSAETAREMALAARSAFDADLSIGVTGSMGNVDPANADSVPGQIYYAIAGRSQEAIFCENYYLELPPQPDRLTWKLLVADEICKSLEAFL